MNGLREAWEENAAAFIAWAREPGHDSYWRFHRDAFLPLVPAPGRRTLDLGCGEGRLSRDLKALGHDVVGIDASPTMLIERLCEPAVPESAIDEPHWRKWQRVPMFLHARAVKPGG